MKFIKQAIKSEVNFSLARLRSNILQRVPHKSYIKKYSKIPRVKSKDRVVVTLTTIPERIDKITVTLNSLLDQASSPDIIYLVIPKVSRITNEPYIIPAWLKNHSIIKILYCDKDYGPATKFIPAFLEEKSNPNTKIIVVDDDRVYAKKLFELLCYWSDKLPECAICGGGLLIDGSGSQAKELSVVHEPGYTTYLTHVDIMQGTDAYLVKPRFFEDRFWEDMKLPEEAYFHDDLLISGLLSKHGVKKYMFPSAGERFNAFTNKLSRYTRSLSSNENNDGKNLDILFKYFAQYW